MPKDVLTLVEEDLHWTIWQELADGTLMGSYRNGMIITTFAEKDLALLHPVLPRAVRDQLLWPGWSGEAAMLFGSDIKCQLHYLTQSPLRLPTSDPGERPYVLTLQALHRLEDSELLELTASAYDVMSVDSREYVTPLSETIRKYVLPPSWFNTHFPGWLPRFEAAEFLGLFDEDLIKHVFTKELQPLTPVTIDMQDVTFD